MSKDSRIFNAWGGAASKSPYETAEEIESDWRADSKAVGPKGKGAGHHRRNSSSLARWFSNFGKASERTDVEPTDELILNHAEDVDVARFTSDLLNDGYRYSTRSLVKAVEVPDAEEGRGGRCRANTGLV